ncbi:Putative cytochrome P450 YjiB [Thalassocella blandensis]|nr:Putative cytochrome P450 YjiB [Thalassocella blandensis]
MKNAIALDFSGTGIDYLHALSIVGEDEKYPLIQQWMKNEPLPFFKQLREQSPILVTEECVLVARFDDVRDMLQMPKIFTVDLYKPKMGVTSEDSGYLMAHDDDALHYREKSLMQGILNREDLPRIRKLVSETSARILNDADGEIDIVAKYTREVPAVLVQEYFGLDRVSTKELIDWSFWNQYDAFHNQPFDLNSQEKNQYIIDEHARVTKELQAYVAKTAARKLALVKIEQAHGMVNKLIDGVQFVYRYLTGKQTKETSSDDIFSRMLRTGFADEVDFNLIRVGVNAGGLLIGAIETTSQAVAQVIHMLLTEPALLEQARKAANERDTKPFDDIVWEALRFVPISPYIFRQASQDYTLAKGTDRETLIKAGTNVLALTQSAMFDHYAYDRPDEFNSDRNWYHHFNYGFGSHECLGKYIGMEMIPEMVRQVIRLPDISAASDIDYKNGPFPEALSLRWAN